MATPAAPPGPAGAPGGHDDATGILPIVTPPPDRPVEGVETVEAEAPALSEGHTRRNWVLPATAAGLGVVALLLLGALLGYRFADGRRAAAVAAAPLPSVPKSDTGALPLEDPPATMPDLVGLSERDAREALGDIGIDTRTIEVGTAPYVGAAGRVIRQRPERGATDPSKIKIVLSQPATVPSVVGKGADEATAAIEELGAAVERVEVYQAGKAVGTVVGIDPAPGQALAPTVSLRVAAAPSSIFVSDLDALSGGCSSGLGSTGTVRSDHSLTCGADYLSEGEAPDLAVAYELAGKVDALKIDAAGISVEDEPGTRARLRIVVDGAERFNQVLTWGSPVTIDLPVTGAARVDIYATQPAAGDDAWDGADIVLVNPTFLGSRDAIDRLTP
jgi:hypothetical protein